MLPRWSRSVLLLSLVLGLSGAACSDANVPSAAPPPNHPVAMPEQPRSLAECKAIDADELLAGAELPFRPSLGYDPLEAASLPLVQASALALDPEELGELGQRGFAISARRSFPTFVYGIAAIYAQDLPVYVSADSILYALHRSYDALLAQIETAALYPDLASLLQSMRGRLATTSAADATRADVDLYLAVATSLLFGEAVAPVAGASAADVAALVAQAEAATGTADVSLFGDVLKVDFSQFEPRGHYKDWIGLERYFRAMIWLGRVELRIFRPGKGDQLDFSRRAFDGAVTLRETLGGGGRPTWDRIHATVSGLVGEPDSMTVQGLDALLGALGAKVPADLDALPDDAIAAAMLAGDHGAQQIASQWMMHGLYGTARLPRSFLLLGQAYVIDSHVFSNVVFDRVGDGKVKRMMPSPLDVGYAVLGNNRAATLLEPELRSYAYAPDLCSMRVLVNDHGEAFWQSSLYNLWLGAIRTLAPGAELGDPVSAGLPRIATTEAWSRRMLNAQLASWAELRHDTLLYAKQPYTGGDSCRFPDAYVDPYPKFYAAIGAYAARGSAIIAGLGDVLGPGVTEHAVAYFQNLGAAAAQLEGMAERQRAGLPLDAGQLAFINEAVKVQEGCGQSYASGWYARMFFDVTKSVELDPTIADVHTQPTDAGGAEVGRVLHVGTGLPRLMVVTADTCAGPRAYVGLVSSYFEEITSGYQRLTDDEWSARIGNDEPVEVPWMHDLVVR